VARISAAAPALCARYHAVLPQPQAAQRQSVDEDDGDDQAQPEARAGERTVQPALQPRRQHERRRDHVDQREAQEQQIARRMHGRLPRKGQKIV
jgi:hypothetical protein